MNKLIITQLKDLVFSFTCTLKKKRIGIGHLVYLANKVLIPKLIYVAQLLTLTEADWTDIFAPMRKVLKHTASLPSSFLTSAFNHNGITGLDDPWQMICTKQISDFAIRLNEGSLALITTEIRLR